MPLGTWLLAMMGPLTARILLALGFSVVSIVGMEVVITTVKNMFLSNLQLVPAAGLQLALLGGVGQGFGIIFGAIATKVVLWNIQNSKKILGIA